MGQVLTWIEPPTQDVHIKDGDMQDVEMEDTEKQGECRSKVREDSTSGQAWNSKWKPHIDVQTPCELTKMLPQGTHHTELSRQTSAKEVIAKILNTQISLTARDILGTSQELSTALADQICFRTVTVATSATHHVISGHKRDSLLLMVPITIGNNTVRAIVDSGSEVNLIRWDIWKQDLKVPMDISTTMELHDANGGMG